MKITVVHPLLKAHQIGGGELVNLSLSKHLGADFYAVSCDTEFWLDPDSPDQFVQELQDYGFEYFAKESRVPVWRKIKRELSMTHTLIAPIIRIGGSLPDPYRVLADYDVVIFGDDIRYLPRGVVGPRKIYYRHTLLHGNEFARQLYKQNLISCDVVVSNSHYSADQLKRELGIDSQVVYPPVEIERFEYISDDGYYIYVGRLETNKNIHKLVDIFTKFPNHRLVIAGDGSLKQWLVTTIKQKNLVNISYVGQQTRKQIAELIGRAHAGIHIVQDEAFGVSPIEYMAAGKCVIGLEGFVLGETLVHGETGYLIPQKYTDSDIQKAFRWIAKNASRCITNCQMNAEQFDSSLYFTKMEALVRQCN